MSEPESQSRSDDTVRRMHRLADLVLEPHMRPDLIVADVLARDARERDLHRWTAGISHDEWLMTLTVRACREILAGATPSETWHLARAAEHEWEAPHRIDTEAMLDRLAVPDRIRTALHRLPVPDRVTVVLHDALDLPLRTCSTICRTPDEITRMHLGRGRMTLIQLLDANVATPDGTCPAQAAALYVDDSDIHADHDPDCAECRAVHAAVASLRATLAHDAGRGVPAGR